MSSNTIVNGAPMTIMRGIQDLSKRTPIVEPEELPTHLPKVYLFAQKGPTTPQLVVGNSRTQMYGEDTFDLRKPYATHQTVLSNIVNAQGNAQMIERILPDDVGPKSNLLLSLDILANQQLPVYQRGTDGNYLMDALGEYMQDGAKDANGVVIKDPSGAIVTPYTVIGFKAKWVVTVKDNVYYTPSALGTVLPGYGQSLVSTGDQTDGTLTSKRYPMLEFQASSEGEFFNNAGVRLWAPDDTTGMNETLMNSLGVYPLRAQVIRRTTANATPYIVQSEYAESYIDFTLKQGQINPATDGKVSLQDIFIDRYQNISDTRFPMKFGEFGSLFVYNDNLAEVVSMLATHDFNVSTHNGDLTGPDAVAPTADSMWKYNFLTGKNANGAPYTTLRFVRDNNAVSMTEKTNLFMGGGFDGTMFEATPAGHYDPVTGPSNI